MGAENNLDHLLNAWTAAVLHDEDQAIVASLASQIRDLAGVDSSTPISALIAGVDDWNPDLHPRGRDGRFIEVFGWIKAVVDMFDGPDGKSGKKKRKEVVGQVEEIIPNKDNPGHPTIRFRVGEGKDARTFDVPHDQVEDAEDQIARLDNLDVPNVDVPEADGATPEVPAVPTKEYSQSDIAKELAARLEAADPDGYEKAVDAVESGKYGNPDVMTDGKYAAVSARSYKENIDADAVARIGKEVEDEFGVPADSRVYSSADAPGDGASVPGDADAPQVQQLDNAALLDEIYKADPEGFAKAQDAVDEGKYGKTGAMTDSDYEAATVKAYEAEVNPELAQSLRDGGGSGAEQKADLTPAVAETSVELGPDEPFPGDENLPASPVTPDDEAFDAEISGEIEDGIAAIEGLKKKFPGASSEIDDVVAELRDMFPSDTTNRDLYNADDVDGSILDFESTTDVLRGTEFFDGANFDEDMTADFIDAIDNIDTKLSDNIANAVERNNESKADLTPDAGDEAQYDDDAMQQAADLAAQYAEDSPELLAWENEQQQANYEQTTAQITAERRAAVKDIAGEKYEYGMMNEVDAMEDFKTDLYGELGIDDEFEEIELSEDGFIIDGDNAKLGKYSSSFDDKGNVSFSVEPLSEGDDSPVANAGDEVVDVAAEQKQADDILRDMDVDAATGDRLRAARDADAGDENYLKNLSDDELRAIEVDLEDIAQNGGSAYNEFEDLDNGVSNEIDRRGGGEPETSGFPSLSETIDRADRGAVPGNDAETVNIWLQEAALQDDEGTGFNVSEYDDADVDELRQALSNVDSEFADTLSVPDRERYNDLVAQLTPAANAADQNAADAVKEGTDLIATVDTSLENLPEAPSNVRGELENIRDALSDMDSDPIKANDVDEIFGALENALDEWSYSIDVRDNDDEQDRVDIETLRDEIGGFRWRLSKGGVSNDGDATPDVPAAPAGQISKDLLDEDTLFDGDSARSQFPYDDSKKAFENAIDKANAEGRDLDADYIIDEYIDRADGSEYLFDDMTETFWVGHQEDAYAVKMDELWADLQPLVDRFNAQRGGGADGDATPDVPAAPAGQISKDLLDEDTLFDGDSARSQFPYDDSKKAFENAIDKANAEGRDLDADYIIDEYIDRADGSEYLFDDMTETFWVGHQEDAYAVKMDELWADLQPLVDRFNAQRSGGAGNGTAPEVPGDGDAVPSGNVTSDSDDFTDLTNSIEAHIKEQTGRDVRILSDFEITEDGKVVGTYESKGTTDGKSRSASWSLDQNALNDVDAAKEARGGAPYVAPTPEPRPDRPEEGEDVPDIFGRYNGDKLDDGWDFPTGVASDEEIANAKVARDNPELPFDETGPDGDPFDKAYESLRNSDYVENRARQQLTAKGIAEANIDFDSTEWSDALDDAFIEAIDDGVITREDVLSAVGRDLTPSELGLLSEQFGINLSDNAAPEAPGSPIRDTSGPVALKKGGLREPPGPDYVFTQFEKDQADHKLYGPKGPGDVTTTNSDNTPETTGSPDVIEDAFTKLKSSEAVQDRAIDILDSQGVNIENVDVDNPDPTVQDALEEAMVDAIDSGAITKQDILNSLGDRDLSGADKSELTDAFGIDFASDNIGSMSQPSSKMSDDDLRATINAQSPEVRAENRAIDQKLVDEGKLPADHMKLYDSADAPDSANASRPALPPQYTDAMAKADGYLDLEEALQDAEVNGWGDALWEKESRLTQLERDNPAINDALPESDVDMSEVDTSAPDLPDAPELGEDVLGTALDGTEIRTGQSVQGASDGVTGTITGWPDQEKYPGYAYVKPDDGGKMKMRKISRLKTPGNEATGKPTPTKNPKAAATGDTNAPGDVDMSDVDMNKAAVPDLTDDLPEEIFGRSLDGADVKTGTTLEGVKDGTSFKVTGLPDQEKYPGYVYLKETPESKTKMRRLTQLKTPGSTTEGKPKPGVNPKAKTKAAPAPTGPAAKDLSPQRIRTNYLKTMDDVNTMFREEGSKYDATDPDFMNTVKNDLNADFPQWRSGKYDPNASITWGPPSEAEVTITVQQAVNLLLGASPKKGSGEFF